jgi:hypothetical protein
MKASILQRPAGSFTVVILAAVAGQFRMELRGEGIKAEEAASAQDGKDVIAFSFSHLVAIEDIEKIIEGLGYDFSTVQVA